MEDVWNKEYQWKVLIICGLSAGMILFFCRTICVYFCRPICFPRYQDIADATLFVSDETRQDLERQHQTRLSIQRIISLPRHEREQIFLHDGYDGDIPIDV
jgi:hypothetical protein